MRARKLYTIKNSIKVKYMVFFYIRDLLRKSIDFTSFINLFLFIIITRAKRC